MPAFKRPAALACCWLALLPLAPVPGSATPICRWVDAQGRTQIAETVPSRYKAVAVCTDSGRTEIPAAQRREAQQRADSDRARAARSPSVPAAAAASAARPEQERASAPAPKRPAQPVTDRTDCATWWRLYDESLACFGPFQTTRGAIKAEAFEVCNVVVSPEPRCGRRRE
jgi:hypothetical protein